MAPSLYAEYLRERTDDEIIETDKGFLSYRFLNDGKSVYIIDVYIRPEFRQQGMAAKMADMVAEIARERGALEMLGSVSPIAKTSTDSLKVLLAYGMRLQSSSENLIILRKGI